MGNNKTTNSTSTTATATPEETAMEKLQLQRLQTNAPAQQQLDTNMYGAMNTIMQGGTLPGNLAGIGGISQDQTNNMTQAALRSVYPQFQSAGIMDSGSAIQGGIATAANVMNSNAQFNVSALQNLFNQALGGSSNLSNSTTSQNQVLGSQLAGLRSVNSTSTQTSMNPFLLSFQNSLGSSMGDTLGSGFGMGGTGGIGAGSGGAIGSRIGMAV